MSSIDTEWIIVHLLEHRGKYPGDPPLERIYSFKTLRGQRRWAIFATKRFDDMAGNPNLTEAVLLLEDGELTDAGRAELARLKGEGFKSIYE